MKKYAINTNVRESIYSIIFIVSLFISALIIILFNHLVKDYAVENFWIVFLNVFILPTMGAINSFFKWLFNNYLWKIKRISKLTKVPDLSGDWTIVGKNSMGFEYSGTLHIQQTFSEILIRGLFEKSKSINEESYLNIRDDEIILSYYYLNEPKQKESNMDIHHGFAKIVFDFSIISAEGKYFNDDFRETKGFWSLKKNN